MYKIPDTEKYATFDIPKRSRGFRTIRSPNEHLKEVQRRLAAILAGCNAEIAECQVERKPIAHGFVTDLSIITNA